MTMRTLFDSSRDIYRAIEKVITYGASQDARLRSEISEYVVTDSIERKFHQLLDKMQRAMESGGEHEVGVWVSGFYGSGKSSFTKYLGLALDGDVRVDGTAFLDRLQDRFNRPQTKALLSTVAKRFPATVVFLDLASEHLAGATMEEVSTVLYYKVLQRAGYSRNLKVAAFERKLKRDERFDEFLAAVEQTTGLPWAEVQNDTLVCPEILPEIAHKLYPDLFRTSTSWAAEEAAFVQFANERVDDMLAILREATGNDCVVFIVDEVGQYVGSRPNLILDLDGLAKNLKGSGNGKAWIIGTAQQTLTEDDPRAALNSPELFKLKDRFPIQLDLESSDIKEICYRRLLGKSSDGEARLKQLFSKHGQTLRHCTKLHEAPVYNAGLEEQSFVNLYPFLPAHFDLLLHLLGALARSTGGIGLRSAIKVIQDILIEGPEGQQPVAERPVGWLATTETLYDALEKDIRRAFPEKHAALSKVFDQFPNSGIHAAVGKTVVVLQLLNNMPVNAQNVASLLHPEVDAESVRDAVDAAIKDLSANAFVPFGEKDGNLCFFSEKLNEIDQERAQIPLRSVETRRIANESLKEALQPLPKVQLHGTLSVGTGLKTMVGNLVTPLAGERDTVQTVVRLVDPTDYDRVRTELAEESRQRTSESTVYLIARSDPHIDELVAEAYRCQEIAQRYRNDPEQEVKEYCSGQADRAQSLQVEVQRALRRQLVEGSFVFRGSVTAVSSLAAELSEAGRKHLVTVAEQVFDRYAEAPARVDTGLAEKFLRLENLRAVTSATDPLGLVQVKGGTPRIDTEHKAIVSIRDYIDRTGVAEGKRLLEYFGEAPFGWSQDTIRYLVAAMLLGGDVKLRISGRDVTANGQQAIEALRTNNSFKKVGVALREERPDTEVLARAAKRLTELSGQQVLPLEDEICKKAAKAFSNFQHRYGTLSERLMRLGLRGHDRAQSLSDDLRNCLQADASDAPSRLGAADSTLYSDLKWADAVTAALDNGLDKTLKDIATHMAAVNALPAVGPSKSLQEDLAEPFGIQKQRLASEEFHRNAPDFSSALTGIKSRIRSAVEELTKAQQQVIRTGQEALRRVPGWDELGQDERSGLLARVENLSIEGTPDLAGLQQLINQEMVIQARVTELQAEVKRLSEDRQRQRLEEEREKAKKEGRKTITRQIKVPASLTDRESLDGLIQQLQKLRNELAMYSDIEVTVQIQE